MDDIKNEQPAPSAEVTPENLAGHDDAKRDQTKPLKSVGPESEVRGGPEAPED